jgi:hypothetical protein
MCFGATAANKGKISGACCLLKKKLGRKFIWLPCKHYMLEVLLSEAFTVGFQPSTDPHIEFFKRLWEKWSKLHHKEPCQEVYQYSATDDLKDSIQQQLMKKHPREDYLELLSLAGLQIGMNIGLPIRKPSSIHTAS